MNGEFTHDTAMLIYTRDRERCFRCGVPCRPWERGRSWSIHHRRPRGSGGTSVDWVGLPSNGILLCGTGTTGCHGWVESHREDARALGYLVPLNGIMRSADVPIMKRDGSWWRLSDTKRPERVFEGEP